MLIAEVRILRPNGTVVVSMRGNAREKLRWKAASPEMEIVDEEGWRLVSFKFDPDMRPRRPDGQAS